MDGFERVHINRLSNSVVLQHLWNSIEDLNEKNVTPTKANVINYCQEIYIVDINEINKNIFLALKEQTICRNISNDVLTKIFQKEDRSQGDWYCFLCHEVGPEIRCKTCDTSFHEACNNNYLADSFHCHTCQISQRFMAKFSDIIKPAKERLLNQLLRGTSKVRWSSLKVVGYLKDMSKNDFFLYREINSEIINRKINKGKYFNISKQPLENPLFDLLILRHNCAVIYGCSHEFYKLTSSYVKNILSELDNIYCDSCYLLEARTNSTTNITQRRQDLFCTVCTACHPVYWVLLPPNIFWPFKVISEDNEMLYGIRFNRTKNLTRHKLEAFHKETSLTWNSYKVEMSDRPSAELLLAISLAQKYLQNMSNYPVNKINCNTTSTDINFDINECTDKLSLKTRKRRQKREVSDIVKKRKVGRPRKVITTKPINELNNNNNSSDTGSIYLPNQPMKKSQKPKIKKPIVSPIHNTFFQRNLGKRRSLIDTVFLSSTDDDEDEDDDTINEDNPINHDDRKEETVEIKTAVAVDYTNHRPIPSSDSDSNYSSDETIPQTADDINNNRSLLNLFSTPSSPSSSLISSISNKSSTSIISAYQYKTIKQTYHKYNLKHYIGGGKQKKPSRIESNIKETRYKKNSKKKLPEDNYSNEQPKLKLPEKSTIKRHRNNKKHQSKSVSKEKKQQGFQKHKDKSVSTKNNHDLELKMTNTNNYFQPKHFIATTSPSTSVFNQTKYNVSKKPTTPITPTLSGGIKMMGAPLATISNSGNNNNNSIETGHTCSSGSPINFSPMSNIYPGITQAQLSLQSPPSSNCLLSSDEIFSGNNWVSPMLSHSNTTTATTIVPKNTTPINNSAPSTSNGTCYNNHNTDMKLRIKKTNLSNSLNLTTASNNNNNNYHEMNYKTRESPYTNKRINSSNHENHRTQSFVTKQYKSKEYFTEIPQKQNPENRDIRSFYRHHKNRASFNKTSDEGDDSTTSNSDKSTDDDEDDDVYSNHDEIGRFRKSSGKYKSFSHRNIPISRVLGTPSDTCSSSENER